AGCNNLGKMYRDGEGVPPDRDRAMALFKKSCDGGAPIACNSLGVLRLKKEQTLPAIEFFEKGCRMKNKPGNEEGWWKLGVIFDQGMGIAKDEARAAAAFLQACQGGSAPGCYELGLIEKDRGGEQDLRQAKEHFERACDGEHAGGCNNAGLMSALG